MVIHANIHARQHASISNKQAPITQLHTLLMDRVGLTTREEGIEGEIEILQQEETMIQGEVRAERRETGFHSAWE